MPYPKFILSAIFSIWMLYDFYLWAYRGRTNLEPVIGLKALVLTLIFLFYDQYFLPPPPLGKLTVFVKDSNDKIPKDLVNKAQIIVFHNKSEGKFIGEDGVVAFDIIQRPEDDSITFELVGTENYELIKSKVGYDGKPIILKIRSTCRFCTIKGQVRSQNQYISDAIVSVDGISDTTDVDGNFDIYINPDMEKQEYIVTVRIKNKIVWEEPVTPNTKERFPILIEKQKK
jgi:hypothetical protein